MNTQIAHLQHTEKKGYLWRKRYDKNTIEISLQTTELAKATARCASITIRFMQLEALAVPFVAMRDTLKGYRDEILRTEKLAILQGLISQSGNSRYEQDALQAPVMGEAKPYLRAENPADNDTARIRAGSRALTGGSEESLLCFIN